MNNRGGKDLPKNITSGENEMEPTEEHKKWECIGIEELKNWDETKKRDEPKTTEGPWDVSQKHIRSIWIWGHW